MSVETPVSVDSQLAQLRRIWMECLGQVIGQVGGFAVTAEPSAEEESAPKGAIADKRPVCMVITASKALQGDMAILTQEPGALALSQVLTSEQLNAAVLFDQEHRDAYDELLRQVLGQLATGLKQAAGGEVEVKPSGSEMPEWSDASRLGIRITGGKLQPIQMTIVVSRELAQSLEPRAEAQAQPEPKSEAPRVAPAPSMAGPAPPPRPEPPAGRNSNLELLLDVKLDATIRFGQKQMLLREVLELLPGTAVALDRLVQEPVELLVGGRVVAHGDVVVVDGNYGIRISEILSPQQRIESLRKQT